MFMTYVDTDKYEKLKGLYLSCEVYADILDIHDRKITWDFNKWTNECLRANDVILTKCHLSGKVPVLNYLSVTDSHIRTNVACSVCKFVGSTFQESTGRIYCTVLFLPTYELIIRRKEIRLFLETRKIVASEIVCQGGLPSSWDIESKVYPTIEEHPYIQSFIRRSY